MQTRQALCSALRGRKPVLNYGDNPCNFLTLEGGFYEIK